jgi:hypothetical protein
MRVEPRPAPTEEVRAELVAHLRLLRGGLERPYGMATLGTALAEEHETTELLTLSRGRQPARIAARTRAMNAAWSGRRTQSVKRPPGTG